MYFTFYNLSTNPIILKLKWSINDIIPHFISIIAIYFIFAGHHMHCSR